MSSCACGDLPDALEGFPAELACAATGPPVEGLLKRASCTWPQPWHRRHAAVLLAVLSGAALIGASLLPFWLANLLP